MNVKGDNNRSVRETKARIQETFLELMKKKSYTKISVREIAEKANINRATFYLHYQDIYDLLEKIEADIYEQIIGAIRRIGREGYIPGQHPQHTELFEALNRNAEPCRILMSGNGDITFMHKLIRIVTQTLRCRWETLNGGLLPNEIDLYAGYVAYGIVGTFFNNLNAEKKRSAAELGFFAGEVTNWIDETFIRNDGGS